MLPGLCPGNQNELATFLASGGLVDMIPRTPADLSYGPSRDQEYIISRNRSTIQISEALSPKDHLPLSPKPA